MLDFQAIKFDEKSLSEYVELFSICFPGSRKYNQEYLRWLYCENPSGPAVGFDAWHEGKLAAHYAGIPVDAKIGGASVKALLSLNTATHPGHQGKGLFTKLAEATYEAAADSGFDCVYGVANANSTPGFLRKLGFQLVQPLDARIGVGRLGIDFTAAAANTQFACAWTSARLQWRCGNPGNKIFSRSRSSLTQFHAATGTLLLPVYAELPACGGQPTKSLESFLSPARLFLGLIPAGASALQHYSNIPLRFRPSPLNFIYRSLSSQTPALERGHIHMSFLDFDAY